MQLTTEIKKAIDQSVLCWLATVSKEGIPNVSPKEVFNYFEDNSIIVANIASPQTIKNIKYNTSICISFIDILVQKGFQINGKATLVDSSNSDFEVMEKVLLKITEGKFPFKSITHITIEKVKPIIAPKYILYPDTTEEEQISSALNTYGFNQ
ncbi:putative _PNPOx domain-containing protein [Tenacibaculum sp. 190524A02b]|uniref:_PNPOx domain-containing protein n=1 Tax=Tenacibaculum vairaonense TaxID=3137860 RepID=A0ABM9PJS4_9FLAO